MKINYVPGLALRFFPGLSRELYDAVDEYIASNCKIAIFTGTAPTEQQVWNLANFNDYVTANTANLVYQETTQLKFTYDGFKHKRVIQRYPIDSTNITTLTGVVAQDSVAIAAGALETPNSLYALVYCPDKDTTLNTTGNDLVLFIPNVGSGATDFCSLSKTNFTSGENIYFRNLTVSLFQGYQITDTLINGEYEDPLNPGQMITGPVDSKKSVYINKVWANRISEAYRDCFISRANNNFKIKCHTQTGGANLYDYTNVSFSAFTNYMSTGLVSDDDSGNASAYIFSLRKYNKSTSTWENSTLFSEMSTKIYKGFLGNQSLIDLIDEINSKAILGQLGNIITLTATGVNTVTWNSLHRFMFHDLNGNAINYPPYPAPSQIPELYSLNGMTFNPGKIDVLPALLVKYIINQSHVSDNLRNSISQLLIELGFDEGLVNSALKSVVPIDFDLSKYNSAFDATSGVLTIQNQTPAKLKTRYKKLINNPTNEQLYIVLPRYLNSWAIENPKLGENFAMNNPGSLYQGTFGSVSYPATQKVIDGEVVDNTTQRIRQQDYTAISIGITGNGDSDLEYDLLDVIDYIDSFTAMVKIPNKF